MPVVDMNEMCVKMLEAATGEFRPSAWTAEEAMSTVEPELREQTEIFARAAISYLSATVLAAVAVAGPESLPAILAGLQPSPSLAVH